MLKQCIFIYLYLFFGVISNFKRINYICKRTWRVTCDVWRWIQKKWHLFLETEKCHKLTFRYSKKIWQFVFSPLNANLLIIFFSPDFSVNVFLTHFIIWCNGKKRKNKGFILATKKNRSLFCYCCSINDIKISPVKLSRLFITTMKWHIFFWSFFLNQTVPNLKQTTE